MKEVFVISYITTFGNKLFLMNDSLAFDSNVLKAMQFETYEMCKIGVMALDDGYYQIDKFFVVITK